MPKKHRNSFIAPTRPVNARVICASRPSIIRRQPCKMCFDVGALLRSNRKPALMKHLSAADFDCALAERSAASAGIDMQTNATVVPPEMHVHVPRLNAEMKTELISTYNTHNVTTPLPTEPLPRVSDFSRATRANVHCVPGGFVIKDKSSFAYDRDCRAPQARS